MEGSHYSEEMREALKPGLTRVSFPYFMNEAVVEFVIEAIRMTAKEGWKLLPQVKYSCLIVLWMHNYKTTKFRFLMQLLHVHCN